MLTTRYSVNRNCINSGWKKGFKQASEAENFIYHLLKNYSGFTDYIFLQVMSIIRNEAWKHR